MKKIKLAAVIFLITVTFFLLGEIILRKFTSYGVDYYVNVNQDYNKILNNSEVIFLNRRLEKELGKIIQNYNRGLIKKQVNVCRIMILGDSIAAGGELDAEELAFPSLLRQILQAKIPELGLNFWYWQLEAGARLKKLPHMKNMLNIFYPIWLLFRTAIMTPGKHAQILGK